MEETAAPYPTKQSDQGEKVEQEVTSADKDNQAEPEGTNLQDNKRNMNPEQGDDSQVRIDIDSTNDGTPQSLKETDQPASGENQSNSTEKSVDKGEDESKTDETKDQTRKQAESETNLPENSELSTEHNGELDANICVEPKPDDNRMNSSGNDQSPPYSSKQSDLTEKVEQKVPSADKDNQAEPEGTNLQDNNRNMNPEQGDDFEARTDSKSTKDDTPESLSETDQPASGENQSNSTEKSDDKGEVENETEETVDQTLNKAESEANLPENSELSNEHNGELDANICVEPTQDDNCMNLSEIDQKLSDHKATDDSQNKVRDQNKIMLKDAQKSKDEEVSQVYENECSKTKDILDENKEVPGGSGIPNTKTVTDQIRTDDLQIGLQAQESEIKDISYDRETEETDEVTQCPIKEHDQSRLRDTINEGVQEEPMYQKVREINENIVSIEDMVVNIIKEMIELQRDSLSLQCDSLSSIMKSVQILVKNEIYKIPEHAIKYSDAEPDLEKPNAIFEGQIESQYMTVLKSNDEYEVEPLQDDKLPENEIYPGTDVMPFELPSAPYPSKQSDLKEKVEQKVPSADKDNQADPGETNLQDNNRNMNPEQGDDSQVRIDIDSTNDGTLQSLKETDQFASGENQSYSTKKSDYKGEVENETEETIDQTLNKAEFEANLPENSELNNEHNGELDANICVEPTPDDNRMNLSEIDQKLSDHKDTDDSQNKVRDQNENMLKGAQKSKDEEVSQVYENECSKTKDILDENKEVPGGSGIPNTKTVTDQIQTDDLQIGLQEMEEKDEVTQCPIKEHDQHRLRDTTNEGVKEEPMYQKVREIVNENIVSIEDKVVNIFKEMIELQRDSLSSIMKSVQILVKNEINKIPEYAIKYSDAEPDLEKAKAISEGQIESQNMTVSKSNDEYEVEPLQDNKPLENETYLLTEVMAFELPNSSHSEGLAVDSQDDDTASTENKENKLIGELRPNEDVSINKKAEENLEPQIELKVSCRDDLMKIITNSSHSEGLAVDSQDDDTTSTENKENKDVSINKEAEENVTVNINEPRREPKVSCRDDLMKTNTVTTVVSKWDSILYNEVEVKSHGTENQESILIRVPMLNTVQDNSLGETLDEKETSALKSDQEMIVQNDTTKFDTVATICKEQIQSGEDNESNEQPNNETIEEEKSAEETNDITNEDVNVEASIADDVSTKEPLRFHSVHGTNIQLSDSGFRAQRKNSSIFYGQGITFSSRPVELQEKIYIQLEEVSDHKVGCLTFGFTNNDPYTLAGKLPSVIITELKNKPGYWAGHLAKPFCRRNNVFHYYLNSTGTVTYGINGIDKGDLEWSVDTTAPLWALVEIFGHFTTVKLIDYSRLSGKSSSENKDTSVNIMTPVSKLPIPSLQYQSSIRLMPLKLHTTIGKNVRTLEFRGVAARSDCLANQGYVFPNSPMRPGQTIVIQILCTGPGYEFLPLGLTCCDPTILEPSDLPDSVEALAEWGQNWVVFKNVANFVRAGDELAVTRTLNGDIRIRKNNGEPITLMRVDRKLRFWMFLEMYGAIQMVRMWTTISQNDRIFMLRKSLSRETI